MACFKNNKQTFVWKQKNTKINKFTEKQEENREKYIKLYHGFHQTDSFYITTIYLYNIPE